MSSQQDKQLEFKPVQFSKTVFEKTGMRDCDFTRGEDYVVGQLTSLRQAKNALLLIACFSPGPDAKQADWELLTGAVEFLLIKRNGRYLGAINRQAPEKFLRFSTGDAQVSILDALGQDGSNLGGRQAATFFCSKWLPHRDGVSITVNVYIGHGWCGGWRDVVIKLPKKELYIARL